MTSVLIVDDHVTVRFGLARLVEKVLGGIIIHYASNSHQALERLRSEPIDMMVTDMNMPDTKVFEYIQEALVINSKLRILVVTINSEELYAQKLLSMGTFGIISKSAEDDVLLAAIHLVAKGKRYISDKTIIQITTEKKYRDIANPFNNLSERELQVAKLLLQGFGLLEIANAMEITTSTASTFKNKVFQKLDVSSVIGLAKLANTYGITWGE